MKEDLTYIDSHLGGHYLQPGTVCLAISKQSTSKFPFQMGAMSEKETGNDLNLK